jgi:hypothetical protein
MIGGVRDAAARRIESRCRPSADRRRATINPENDSYGTAELVVSRRRR